MLMGTMPPGLGPHVCHEGVGRPKKHIKTQNFEKSYKINLQVQPKLHKLT